MSDPVEVTNANWATEDTLKQLLDVIESNFGESSKLQKQMADALKSGKNGIADAAKHINSHAKSTSANNAAVVKSTVTLTNE